MLYPSFRRIEVFVAVADGGSFSAAAARLGIAQPSISEHIRALEKSVGHALLHRAPGRPAQLTPAGAALLERARDVIRQVEQLQASLSPPAPRRSERIVIASQRRVANAVLPEVIAAFARSHPTVELVVRSGGTEEVMAMLQSGEVDLAYFLGNLPLPGIHSEVVAHEPLVFVAAPGHPLARRKRIQPRELGAERFIRGAANSLFGREMDALLASLGLGAIEVASRSTDEAIIRQLVASGVGIHLTLARSVQSELREGVLKRLAVATPPLSLAVRQALREHPRPTELARRFCRVAAAQWGVLRAPGG